MGWAREMVKCCVDGRKKTATIVIDKHEPYVIRCTSDHQNFTPELEAITTYDEAKGDDSELQIYESKCNLNVIKDGDTLSFSGVIEVDLLFVPSAKHMELLEENGYVIDYALSFMDGEEDLEADEDYVFVKNYNTSLDIEGIEDDKE